MVLHTKDLAPLRTHKGPSDRSFAELISVTGSAAKAIHCGIATSPHYSTRELHPSNKFSLSTHRSQTRLSVSACRYSLLVLYASAIRDKSNIVDVHWV